MWLKTHVGVHGLVVGSGRLVTREMDFSDFSAVEVGNAFEVKISRSDSHGVSITADDNLFDYVKADKRGVKLRIGLKSGYSYQMATLRARVTMPDLYRLRFPGATRGRGFSSSHELTLNLSGASSPKLIGIQAGDAETTLSEGSLVTGVLRASGDRSIEACKLV